MREWVEFSSQGIQALAVIVIVVSVIFGSLRFLLQLLTKANDPYRTCKELLGRSLLLSLELLIAADVIRTVLLDLTAKGMEILGALVVIRTWLSWTVMAELEGRWPWRLAARETRSQETGGGDARKQLRASAGGIRKLDDRPTEGSLPPANRDEVVSAHI
jgi:uncharacterized membrane protein